MKISKNFFLDGNSNIIPPVPLIAIKLGCDLNRCGTCLPVLANSTRLVSPALHYEPYLTLAKCDSVLHIL